MPPPGAGAVVMAGGADGGGGAMLKLNSMVAITGTGLPSMIVGVNSH